MSPGGMGIAIRRNIERKQYAEHLTQLGERIARLEAQVRDLGQEPVH